ncbi:MAG: VCBS repeat-containing protein, partial [Chloroflexi bacterium]|nr:VCBS repeat-containing protein [Chloroflexota bacterium]
MRTRHAAGLLLATGLAACGPNGIELGGGSSNDWLFPLTVATDVAVIDIDGDGRADVLTLEQLSTSDTDRKGRLLVYRQTTPGVFAAADVHLVGYYPWHFAIADINDDGAPDLVITDPSAGDVWLLRQDAGDRGDFQAPVRLASDIHAYSVAVADLNGDGAIDIAMPVGRLATSSMFLLYQDPANPGSFLPEVELELPGPGSHAAAGDLNQDGRPDLALQIRTAGGSTDPPTNAIGYLPQLPD